MKPPSFISITLLAIYVVLMTFELDTSELDYKCIRKVEGDIQWGLRLPISFILFVAASLEVNRIAQDFKKEFPSVLVASPILLHGLMSITSILVDLLMI